jgi:hypothetical protein
MSADRHARPLYFVALLLIGLPLLDFVGSALPLRLGSIEWRFGAFGVLSGFLLTPMLGVLVAIGAATVLGHQRVVRAIGIVSVVVGIVLVAALTLFLLDAIQLRGAVPHEQMTAFKATAARAVIKALAGAAAFIWIGVVGMRGAAEEPAPAKPRRPTAGGAPMLVAKAE